MKYGKLMTLVLVTVAALALLAPGTSLAEEPPTLVPGYIAGTVTVGDLNVSDLSVSASGGGFSSSRSVNGNTYSLTVQTGDFDHNVSLNATIRPAGTDYPYTLMYFNNRTLHVPAYTTVQNNYSVDYGTVRYQINITGDPYNSWYIYAYANKSVAPPAERTYSRLYTTSSYSPDGIFEMPVVPNQQVQLYAYLYIDEQIYGINTSSYYADIVAGETKVITVDIVHTAPQLPDTGTIQGTVDLNNVENLYYHRIYGSMPGRVSGSVPGAYKEQNLWENPANYLLQNVWAGPWGVSAYTYMNSGRTYLRWPYIDGDSNNNRTYVQPGQTHTLDFISDTGVLTGDITFTGTLSNEDMEYYHLLAQGVSWIDNVRQPTGGGASYDQQYGTDPDNTYRLILQPGPWQTYTINARSYENDLGYDNLVYMNLYDYTRYYNGSTANFGQNAEIVAGETTVLDVDYCMGSLLLTYQDASGSLLRNPRAMGSASTRNEQNTTVTSWSVNAWSYAPLMENPQVEVHGPDGVYNLACSAYTEDDSFVTFARFNVELECGVAKGRDIYGPSITVDTPEANSITNAQTVTVSGTVTDESGVASIEVNGIPVNFVSTNNPDDPNEVSFSYDLTVTSGENTITVTASETLGHQASDSRKIYADHWMPTVSIISPADGTHYSHVTGQFSLDVQAADQGYGFTLTVSLDGVEIGTVTGEGDDTAPVSVSISDIIQGPLAIGDHVITAVATDVAGNVTTATSTITVYLAADIEVKPEATHNVTNGTSTIFIVLPNGLTPTASLNIMDNREITATPDQYPVEVKLSGDNKLTLKFDRTPELMDDIYYTVQGKYCPNPNNPAECYTWQGSDTTNW